MGLHHPHASAGGGTVKKTFKNPFFYAVWISIAMLVIIAANSWPATLFVFWVFITVVYLGIYIWSIHPPKGKHSGRLQ